MLMARAGPAWVDPGVAGVLAADFADCPAGARIMDRASLFWGPPSAISVCSDRSPRTIGAPRTRPTLADLMAHRRDGAAITYAAESFTKRPLSSERRLLQLDGSSRSILFLPTFQYRSADMPPVVDHHVATSRRRHGRTV